jgi:predicted MPP superfamily phosphohydrolase
MLRIANVSDLHLDFPENAKFILNGGLDNNNDIDVLVIAGDTCTHEHRDIPTVKAAIKHLQDEYKFIIEIPGNHSYWGLDFIDDRSEFKSFTKELVKDKHWYVNNEVVTINNVSFICSALWSNVDLMEYSAVATTMNDYYFIEYFFVSDSTCLHLESVKFIQAALEKVGDNVPYVVTHHVPVLGTADQFKSCGIMSAYESDLAYMLSDWKGYWLHGHTHCKYDEMHWNVRVMRNPLGYPSEGMKYKPLIIDIEG